MAKPIRKKDLSRRRAGRELPLPLSKKNYQIIGLGLVVIVAGYLAMLTGTVEGFLPLVVSPVLLVVGYCVLVPIGIMYREKAKPAEPVGHEVPARP